MGVFGGDSWARQSQQRKRRLDDLMLPASASSSSSPSSSGSFKRLPSGKFACLVCPHRPVLDSPLMLSMHNKGSRHVAAESSFREKELSRQQEINKRLALSSEAFVSNRSNQYPGVRPSDTKETPLVEQTRRAILEAQSSRFNNISANKEFHDPKRTKNALNHDSQVAPSRVQMEKWTKNTGLVESKNNERGPLIVDQTSKVLSERVVDLKKRQEQELRFTSSGWKRDCHGKWFRDEKLWLNLTQMKMILTSASVKHVRRYSGCFRNLKLSFECHTEGNLAAERLVHIYGVNQPDLVVNCNLKHRPAKNALLSDIAISTAAAPTFFPAHYFETKDDKGETRAFNLVDGGMAANNPTLCAMSQVTQNIILENGGFFPLEPVDCGKFMVISVGCGSNRSEKYSAKAATKWGILNWFIKDGTAPIVDMFNSASADMVDIHLNVLFSALRSSHHYLRIQYDQLSGSAGSIDDCSKANMDRLVQIGEELLKRNVCRVDLETGRNVEVPGDGTNSEQLAKFAKQLYDERRRRKKELQFN